MGDFDFRDLKGCFKYLRIYWNAYLNDYFESFENVEHERAYANCDEMVMQSLMENLFHCFQTEDRD